MTILCYHQKGGVGKTTTSVHVALGLLGAGRTVLVVDGDTQAHSCAFFGVSASDAEDGPVEVARATGGALHVVHAAYPALRRVPRTVGADDVVIDLSADYEGVAPAVLALNPTIALVCVKPNAGALRDLDQVVNALVRETDAEVRVVPIGVSVEEIRASLAGLPDAAYVLTGPVSYVPDEAERSFDERRPVWELPGCAAMKAEYDALIAP